MDLGVHLPLMQFGERGLSLRRLESTVDTARDCGFAAISANDHFVFQTPWLDGPTALASMIERSGQMTLATTVSLAVLRGPVPLAKSLVAIDILSDGRLVAALGPGSSERDYDILGVPFEERWKRFDEALAVLRALLKREPMPEQLRYYPVTPDTELAPGPRRQDGIPLWIGSWVLAPVLKRDPDDLRTQVCVGPAEHCAELLSRYAEAGCERIYLWPLGNERRQLELVAGEVAPQLGRR